MACSSMSYTPFPFMGHVFITGLNGATSMALSSGGGGTSNDMPWRDKDEDLLDWARRAYSLYICF